MNTELLALKLEIDRLRIENERLQKEYAEEIKTVLSLSLEKYLISYFNKFGEEV